MKDLIKQFAARYVEDVRKQRDDGDAARGLHNPALFLFIGDNSLETLKTVYEQNEHGWKNGDGVVYLHLYTRETLERPNVIGFRLPIPDGDKQTIRPAMHEQFYDDNEILIDLNKVMKQATVRLAEMGSRFASVQRVQLAVVTQADDAANVLVPEVSLLLKSYLDELFKNVHLDLFVLLRERNSGEAFGFSAALGVSFLEELNRYQQHDYRFCQSLLITEDAIKLPVEHESGPLFSLVYLLSDKDERGLFMDRGIEENGRIIHMLTLLKNRGADQTEGDESDRYNNLQFIRSISAGDGTSGFASAGYARVQRPNHTISLTVLAQLYDGLLERLKRPASLEQAEALEWLEATPALIQKKVLAALPEETRIEEMAGLMSNSVSYSELKSMTLQEAEIALYDGVSQAFFERHFVREALDRLNSLGYGERFLARMREKLIDDERCGLYLAYRLTSEEDAERGLLGGLRKQLREASRQREAAQAELADLYRRRVDRLDIRAGGIFTRDRERVRTFVRELFPLVYGKRYELLGLELEIRLLRDLEERVIALHHQLQEEIGQLEGLQRQLQEISREGARETAADLDKNITEYYGPVVRQIFSELEAKHGSRWLWEERYFGSGSRLLHKGVPGLMHRLCEVCRRDFLTSPLFSLPFETELLERANVAAGYDNQGVLSQEALFLELHRLLEERAAIHLDVFQFRQKHRYEEKYFFADAESDFIQYALQQDLGTRTYKLGCVHEKNKSGIEKLNLMGGFGIADLTYYQHNKKYYDSYAANGFSFHCHRKDAWA